MPASDLRANAYNPNTVFTSELKLLALSILRTGWTQPLLIHHASLEIIDGFHRWMISKHEPEMQRRWGGLVPCARLKVTPAEAMMLTVRINRAKGTHVAVKMSALVIKLVNELGVSRQDVASGIGAGLDEIDLLLKADVFKARDIPNWNYSKAWVPIEVKSERGGASEPDVAEFERGSPEDVP